MADLAEFAKELVGKTTKDAEKLLKILKEDYGIVPADFEETAKGKSVWVLPKPFVDRRYTLSSKRKKK